MRFVLEVYIDTEEMDEAHLEMYVASQIMGGPLECEAVVTSCDETSPDICPDCGFSRLGPGPLRKCTHPMGCGLWRDYGKK